MVSVLLPIWILRRRCTDRFDDVRVLSIQRFGVDSVHPHFEAPLVAIVKEMHKLLAKLQV